MAKQKAERERKVRGGGFVPALCSFLGMVLLLAVIGLSLPLAIPAIMGYQTYEVVTGSMEPEIPVGSVIYVEPVDPAIIEEGDVVAFHDGNNIIAHRVVTNRTSLGEFVTKGDANNVEDLDPIPYDAVVGSVKAHLPYLGAFMSIYASTAGKVYLLLAAACGVMLNLLAGRIREARRREIEELEFRLEQAKRLAEEGGSAHVRNNAASEAAIAAALSGKRRGSRVWGVVRNALIVVLAVVFVGSAGVIGYVNYQYSKSDALYSDTASKYTRVGEEAPIEVDFESLCAENPDIVGWIYCEGTPLNYPVLHGKDNDQYLHTDYTGAYNIDGSIFVDGDNSPGFADSNTIIYGHHMNSGSMFACLEDWTSQEFYDDHPVVWLLTPTQDYQIVLFAGHHVNVYSDYYDIIDKPGEKLDSILKESLEESDFKADVPLDPATDHYVMLSTCAYVFDNARYALHGVLLPGSTAGGKPLPAQ